MKRFRFSSWKFMLVMFVLIAIFFYDLGYIEEKKTETQIKESNISTGTVEEDDFEVYDVQ